MRDSRRETPGAKGNAPGARTELPRLTERRQSPESRLQVQHCVRASTPYHRQRPLQREHYAMTPVREGGCAPRMASRSSNPDGVFVL